MTINLTGSISKRPHLRKFGLDGISTTSAAVVALFDAIIVAPI
jgi:hypothetical protein